jgi:hypothetical protein
VLHPIPFDNADQLLVANHHNLMTRDWFPSKSWEEMDPNERDYFSDMPEEELVARWRGEMGQKIKERIIAVNYVNGSSKEYKAFVGTVKVSLSDDPPKIDLRGIDFSDSPI